MNTNLPMKKKNGFIDKIKNFFKKLFNKKDNNNNLEQTSNLIEDEIKVEYNTKSNFQDSIKVEVKDEYSNNLKREEFLKEVESNPSLLYELPIDKLEKLEKYYDESIAKYVEKLSKLKKAV